MPVDRKFIGTVSEDRFVEVEKAQLRLFAKAVGDPSLIGLATRIAIYAIAAASLVERQEERKLILLLTDGDPGNLPAALAVAREAVAADIEIAYVFIGSGGSAYEEELQRGKLGRVGRCRQAANPAALARAIEDALAAVLAQYIHRVAP